MRLRCTRPSPAHTRKSFACSSHEAHGSISETSITVRRLQTGPSILAMSISRETFKRATRKLQQGNRNGDEQGAHLPWRSREPSDARLSCYQRRARVQEFKQPRDKIRASTPGAGLLYGLRWFSFWRGLA